MYKVYSYSTVCSLVGLDVGWLIWLGVCLVGGFWLLGMTVAVSAWLFLAIVCLVGLVCCKRLLVVRFITVGRFVIYKVVCLCTGMFKCV